MKKSRFLLWLCVLAITITGVALYIMTPADEDSFPHPLTGLFRELHGVSMVLALVMFGYMFADHVQKKFAKGKHHWDGYLHIGVWVVLIITGLLLYYPQFFIEEAGVVVPELHWYFGLLLMLLFPLHYWRKALKRRYYRWRFPRSSAVPPDQ